jgi:cell wall-associated NlpC family hydrolase
MRSFDRRLVAARPEIAAEHLRGAVEAARFVSGVARRVIETAAPLRREPNPDAELDTEAIYGEAVMVYDEIEGWAWGQLRRDGYVGWLPAHALGEPLEPTHRVSAVRSFVYPTASIKRPNLMALTMGSEVRVTGEAGLFDALASGGFVFARHLAPIDSIESDPVAVAEQFLGAPYLWGGKTSLGLDCSALVQTALLACGMACPRDTDMQEREVGMPVALGPDLSGLRRGDLLFWPGHVAMARDGETMIHANGHSMTVRIEGVHEALARIAATGDALRTVKRIR